MASRMRRTERTTLSCTTARHERRSSLNVFGEFISWKFLSVVDLPDSLWPVGGGRDSLAGRSERDEQGRRCRQFSVQWFTPLLAVTICACTPLSPLALHTPHQLVGKVNAPSNRILTGGGPLRSAARWRFSSSSMRSEMRFASSSAASRSWRSASLFACAASKFKDAAGRNRESKGQKQARGRKRGGGRGRTSRSAGAPWRA